MIRSCISILLFIVCLIASWPYHAKSEKQAERKRFPDRSTKPLLPADALKIVAELPDRPGNLDVDPETGRVFFTFHPFGNPQQSCKVCELKEQFKGFEEFGDQSLFRTVLSIRVSPRKRQLLALDHKNFGEEPPALYVFQLDTKELVKTFTFQADIAAKGSFLNDFVVSKDENFIFIADSGVSGEPSVITVNMKDWTVKKALVAHESTKVRDTPKDFPINGKKYEFSFKVGVDSIALSPDGNTLYFGAIFDPYMWMVPTRSLVFGKGDPESSVDIAFPKPVTDGIVIDETTGLLYATDFEHSAIWMTDPSTPGRAKTLIVNNALLRWPDGLSAARGFLWITASALNELFDDPPTSRPPYHILRIPLMNPEEPVERRNEL